MIKSDQDKLESDRTLQLRYCCLAALHAAGVAASAPEFSAPTVPAGPMTSGSITCAAFSDRGDLLAVSDDLGRVYVWALPPDLESAQTVRGVRAHVRHGAHGSSACALLCLSDWIVPGCLCSHTSLHSIATPRARSAHNPKHKRNASLLPALQFEPLPVTPDLVFDAFPGEPAMCVEFLPSSTPHGILVVGDATARRLSLWVVDGCSADPAAPAFLQPPLSAACTYRLELTSSSGGPAAFFNHLLVQPNFSVVVLANTKKQQVRCATRIQYHVIIFLCTKLGLYEVGTGREGACKQAAGV